MTAIDVNEYQQVSIREGTAPFLMGKVTDKALAIILKADISTIKATIVNVSSGATVLDQSALTKADVWYDTYQTLTNAAGRVITYNFGWQTLATYFSTTSYADDSQFKVEVWVTPVSGQPFEAGWWLVTARKSIVPIPA